MKNKTKIVLIVLLVFSSIIIFSGLAYFLGINSCKPQTIETEDKSDDEEVEEGLSDSDIVEEGENVGEVTDTSSSSQSQSSPQTPLYMDDIYAVYTNSGLTFKYKYPYGWHVREGALSTDNGTNYSGILYIDNEPITDLEGPNRYIIMAQEITSISPSYVESYYSSNGGEKLLYDLKVEDAYCYKMASTQSETGYIYSCVFDLGNQNRKLFLSLIESDYLDKFQVIAESIERI